MWLAHVGRGVLPRHELHRGHETRSALVEGRLDYPDNHIEADNRLAWFLGSLYDRFGDESMYVHLTRDRNAVVASYEGRWERHMARGRRLLVPGVVGFAIRHPRYAFRALSDRRKDPLSRPASIVPAFAYGVLQQNRRVWSADERRRITELYVDTVNENITEFLRNRKNVATIRVEQFPADVEALWQRLGAEGDLDAAIRELSVRHNAS